MSSRPLVLLVEDYADNRELVGAVLEAGGMSVAAAADGGAATLLLDQGIRPDLLLVDIGLPNEDGYALMRRLRQDPRCAGAPLVALTSHAMRGDSERALAAGFDGYLTKPIEVATFAATVRAMLPG